MGACGMTVISEIPIPESREVLGEPLYLCATPGKKWVRAANLRLTEAGWLCAQCRAACQNPDSGLCLSELLTARNTER